METLRKMDEANKATAAKNIDTYQVKPTRHITTLFFQASMDITTESFMGDESIRTVDDIAIKIGEKPGGKYLPLDEFRDASGKSLAQVIEDRYSTEIFESIKIVRENDAAVTRMINREQDREI